MHLYNRSISSDNAAGGVSLERLALWEHSVHEQVGNSIRHSLYTYVYTVVTKHIIYHLL